MTFTYSHMNHNSLNSSLLRIFKNPINRGSTVMQNNVVLHHNPFPMRL
jgi:hypothetical protein